MAMPNETAKYDLEAAIVRSVDQLKEIESSAELQEAACFVCDRCRTLGRELTTGYPEKETVDRLARLFSYAGGVVENAAARKGLDRYDKTRIEEFAKNIHDKARCFRSLSERSAAWHSGTYSQLYIRGL